MEQLHLHINSALLPKEVAGLLTNIPSKKINDNEVIVNFKDKISDVIYLKNGLLAVYENHNGQEILLYHILPGEISISTVYHRVNELPSEVKIISLKPSEIILVNQTHLNDFSHIDCWNKYIINQYQKRLEKLQEKYNSCISNTMRNRIANYLNNLQQVYKSNFIKITHTEIAKDIGSTREVISRELKQMEKDGKIELFRGKIRIVNLN